MRHLNIEGLKHFLHETLPEFKSKVESNIHSALQALRHLPRFHGSSEASSTTSTSTKLANVKKLDVPTNELLQQTQKETPATKPSGTEDPVLDTLDREMTQSAAGTTLVASTQLASSFSPTGSPIQPKVDWSDNPEKVKIGDRVLINKNDPTSSGVVTNILTAENTGKLLFWVKQQNGVGDLYAPNQIGIVEKEAPSTPTSLPFGVVKGGVSPEVRQSLLTIPLVNTSITSQMNQVESITNGQLTSTELQQLATFMTSPEMKEAEMNAEKSLNGVYIQRDQFGEGQPPRSISICKEGDQIHHFVELKALGLSTTYQESNSYVKSMREEIATFEKTIADSPDRIDQINTQIEQKRKEIRKIAEPFLKVGLPVEYIYSGNGISKEDHQQVQTLRKEISQLSSEADSLSKSLRSAVTDIGKRKELIAKFKKDALTKQGIQLGAGTSKDVRRALQWDPETNTQKIVASARIKDPTDFENALNESRLQRELGTGITTARITTGGKEKILQFTELANMGDGYSILKSSTWNQLSSKNRQQIFFGVLQNVIDFHTEGYLLRDIKPANFLFNRDPEGNIEVITNDLGLAVKGVPTSVGGTPFFISPTVLHLHETQDQRDDAYQLGVTLWVFSHQNIVDQNGKERTAPSIPSWIQNSYEILQHEDYMDDLAFVPLFTDKYNKIKREVDTNGTDMEKIAIALMDPDPNTRMSTETAEKLFRQLPESAFTEKLPYR